MNQEIKLPPLPTWSLMDDICNLVSSEIRTAMKNYATAAVLADRAERKPDWAKLYEDIRKITDGGSESMTHEDAVKQIEYWRDRSLSGHTEAEVAALIEVALDADEMLPSKIEAEIRRILGVPAP